MPVYTYQCPNCEKTFEESSNFLSPIQSLPCPNCGTESQKTISIPAIIFKGDGFTKSKKDE